MTYPSFHLVFAVEQENDRDLSLRAGQEATQTQAAIELGRYWDWVIDHCLLLAMSINPEAPVGKELAEQVVPDEFVSSVRCEFSTSE